MLDFEWDPAKAHVNLDKHGVDFQEAVAVFRDPLAITVADPDHSAAEDRYLTIGTTLSSRALIVAHTDRGDRVRLISARELTRAERRAYEDATKARRR
jgi:uncharacterized DUF497 family protein